jgi:hypothetical protein
MRFSGVKTAFNAVGACSQNAANPISAKANMPKKRDRQANVLLYEFIGILSPSFLCSTSP